MTRPHAQDPEDAWTTHAEECLYLLALELRRLPLRPHTKRLHLQALALKREVAGWRRGRPPEMASRLHLLDEIESLARAVREGLKRERPDPGRGVASDSADE